MEERKRKRNLYVSAVQKKKLIELLAKHPLLISGKRSQDFTHTDAQRLWQSIAKECNSIPGAKKHWRQWKKTWQDMRSKYAKRRRLSANGEPSISVMLTPEEREVLFGAKADDDYTEIPEFIPLNDNQENFHDENMSAASVSDPPSPQEEKVFTLDQQESKVNSLYQINSKCDNDKSEQSGSCNINCDLIVANEQKKIKLKQDYIDFKKDYLRQKLKLLKEQTDALKSIAREICNK